MEPIGFVFIALLVIGLFCAVVYSKPPGRTLANITSLLLCVVAVLLFTASFASAMLPVPGFGSVLFWLGVVTLVIGMMISRSSSRKTCPQCAERVKVEAIKCRYCGHDFAAASAQTAASKPV